MFKRVDHVVIAVTDLDKASELYGRDFGIKASPPEQHRELGAKRVRFDVGNAFVDVVQPVEESSPLHGFLKDRGEGIYLIAVQVDDLARTVSDLERKGAQIIREGGRVLVSPKTTHGALMQLIG